MRTSSAFVHLTMVVFLALAIFSPAARAGLVFGNPGVVNSTAAVDGVNDNDFYPRIATDGMGHWVAVWESINTLGNTVGTDSDIFVSSSLDNGTTWSTTAALNTDATTDSYFDGGPSIATDSAGNWVCVWTSANPNSTNTNIRAARSTNNGVSWTTPADVNSNAAVTTSNEQGTEVRTDGSGNWVCVWYSYQSQFPNPSTDEDLYFARSIDNGATWSTQQALNANAATDSGQDDIPKLATDGNGNWVCVWQANDTLSNTVGSDYDVFVAYSANDGASWSVVSALNTNAGTDGGDDIRPTVASDGQGNWVAVWQAFNTLGANVGGDYDISVARSTDNGATWTNPQFLDANATTDTYSDWYPVVVTDGSGQWVVVWESDDSLGGTIGTDGDILNSVSLDNGATWSAPMPVNTNAATDTQNDVYPDIATDGAGRWIAMWPSGENLTGTIGTDDDIFAAISDTGLVDALTLTRPNGGEKWRMGKKRKIQWVSAGNPGAAVKLELLRSNNFVRVIKTSTPNDGAQRWKIPTDLVAGGRYKVRITSTTNPSISDISDRGFRLKPPK